MANYQLSHTGAKIDEAIGKALTALQTMPKHTHSVDDITGLNNTSSASVANNLLDNSNFLNPINQRGAASGDYNWEYIIDRWQAKGNGFKLSADGAEIPAAGRMVQHIVKATDAAKVYTGVAMGGDGTLYINDGGAVTITVNRAKAEYDEVIVTNTGSAPVTIVWVAMYEGEYTADNLPTYVPKGYAAELHECMRYYVRIPTTAQLTIIGYAHSATAARFSVPVGIQMRSAPELSFGNLSSCRIYPGAITPTGIGGRAVVGSMVTFALTAASTSGLKADDMIVLRPGTMMELSADL